MNFVKRIAINIAYGNQLVAVLRILMGALFIFSGFFKVLDLNSFGTVILRYRILPEILIPYAAIVFPFLELTVGCSLLCGFRIRSNALIAIALMLAFIFAISVNVIRGETFDCGCFELNRFGIDENISTTLIIRDLCFVLVLYIIFNAKRHYYSLDNFIEKKQLTNL
jgi:uncharacterized membrane protein YphA (DoxX/SURF4 family)